MTRVTRDGPGWSLERRGDAAGGARRPDGVAWRTGPGDLLVDASERRRARARHRMDAAPSAPRACSRSTRGADRAARGPADDGHHPRRGWCGCPASARAAGGCAGRTSSRWTAAPARRAAGGGRCAATPTGPAWWSPSRRPSGSLTERWGGHAGRWPRSWPTRPRWRWTGRSGWWSATAPRCPGTSPRPSSTARSSAREVAALAERLELPEAEVLAEAVGGPARARRVDGPASRSSSSPGRCGRCTRAPGTSQVDAAGLERLRELNRRHPLVFLPSHRSYVDPLVLADVLAAHDFPRNHVMGGDNLRFWPVGAARQARRAWCSSGAASATTRSTSSPSASTSRSCWPSGSTSSGTWRAAAPAPASCARRATGCCASSPTRSSAAGSRTSTSCRSRSPTTSSARSAAMAAEQGGAAKRGEGLSWLASLRPRAAATPLGHGPRRVRRADLAGAALAAARTRRDPDARRLALQKVAFEVAVGINSVTPATATALVTLALLGVRDRALTLGAGAARARAGAGLPRPSAGCRTRAARCAPPAGVRRVLARAGAAGRGHHLRRRRGAGVRDRARPAPRRRLLPQQRRSTTSSTARSPSWCCSREPGGPLGRGARGCATC